MSGVKTAQFDSTDVRITPIICGGCVYTTLPGLITVRTILHHLHQHKTNTVMTQLKKYDIHKQFTFDHCMHTHHTHNFFYLLVLDYCTCGMPYILRKEKSY